MKSYLILPSAGTRIKAVMLPDFNPNCIFINDCDSLDIYSKKNICGCYNEYGKEIDILISDAYFISDEQQEKARALICHAAGFDTQSDDQVNENIKFGVKRDHPYHIEGYTFKDRQKFSETVIELISIENTNDFKSELSKLIFKHAEESGQFLSGVKIKYDKNMTIIGFDIKWNYLPLQKEKSK